MSSVDVIDPMDSGQESPSTPAMAEESQPSTATPGVLTSPVPAPRLATPPAPPGASLSVSGPQSTLNVAVSTPGVPAQPRAPELGTPVSAAARGADGLSPRTSSVPPAAEESTATSGAGVATAICTDADTDGVGSEESLQDRVTADPNCGRAGGVVLEFWMLLGGKLAISPDSTPVADGENADVENVEGAQQTSGGSDAAPAENSAREAVPDADVQLDTAESEGTGESSGQKAPAPRSLNAGGTTPGDSVDGSAREGQAQPGGTSQADESKRAADGEGKHSKEPTQPEGGDQHQEAQPESDSLSSGNDSKQQDAQPPSQSTAASESKDIATPTQDGSVVAACAFAEAEQPSVPGPHAGNAKESESPLQRGPTEGSAAPTKPGSGSAVEASQTSQEAGSNTSAAPKPTTPNLNTDNEQKENLAASGETEKTAVPSLSTTTQSATGSTGEKEEQKENAMPAAVAASGEDETPVAPASNPSKDTAGATEEQKGEKEGQKGDKEEQKGQKEEQKGDKEGQKGDKDGQTGEKEEQKGDNDGQKGDKDGQKGEKEGQKGEKEEQKEAGPSANGEGGDGTPAASSSTTTTGNIDDDAAKAAFEARQKQKALLSGPRPPHCVDVLEGCHVTRKRSVLSPLKLRQHFDGKMLALYFGAWSPPCEAFNPVLYALYYHLQNRRMEAMRARAEASEKQASEKKAGDASEADVELPEVQPELEIVFASSDVTLANYKEMTRRMPWCLLPFNDANVTALAKRFKVTGVPTVVLVDTDGSVICRDVTRFVQGDPEGYEFPWRPLPLWNIIDDKTELRWRDEDLDWLLVDRSRLRQCQYLGVYVSGIWANNILPFNDILCHTYERLRKRGVSFEVVFASVDRCYKDYRLFRELMPWLVLPYGDKREALLCQRLEIESLPALVIVDAYTGDIIKQDARPFVQLDPAGINFPWPERLLLSIDEVAGLKLDTHPCCIIFLDGVSREVGKSAMAAFQAIVIEFTSKWRLEGRDDNHPLTFVFGDEDMDLTWQLRGFLQLNVVAPPNLVILDVPNQLKYLWVEEKPDSDNETYVSDARSVVSQANAEADADASAGQGIEPTSSGTPEESKGVEAGEGDGSGGVQPTPRDATRGRSRETKGERRAREKEEARKAKKIEDRRRRREERDRRKREKEAAAKVSKYKLVKTRPQQLSKKKKTRDSSPVKSALGKIRGRSKGRSRSPARERRRSRSRSKSRARSRSGTRSVSKVGSSSRSRRSRGGKDDADESKSVVAENEPLKPPTRNKGGGQVPTVDQMREFVAAYLAGTLESWKIFE